MCGNKECRPFSVKLSFEFARNCALAFPHFSYLKINSHHGGARDLFPAAALPEFAAAQIILGHHDNDALDPGPAQTHQAFIQQTPAESASLVRRLNRQMIDMPAAPIVTAYRNA